MFEVSVPAMPSTGLSAATAVPTLGEEGGEPSSNLDDGATGLGDNGVERNGGELVLGGGDEVRSKDQRGRGLPPLELTLTAPAPSFPVPYP
jgi:hypothetical protein